MPSYELNVRDYWRIIQKRRWSIIVMTVLVAAFTLVLTWKQKPIPIYQAFASVRVEPAMKGSALAFGGSFYSTASLDTEVYIATSFPVMVAAAKQLGLLPESISEQEVHQNNDYLQVIEDLRASMAAEKEEFANIINITATMADPELAQRTANVVVEAYRKYNIATKNRQVHDARVFVEERLAKLRAELREAEDRLQAFKEKGGFIRIDYQSARMLDKQMKMEEQLEGLNARIAEAEANIVLLRSDRTLTQDSIVSLRDKSVSTIASLNRRLVNLHIKYDTLLETYLPEHPKVKAVRAELINTRDRIIDLIEEADNSVLFMSFVLTDNDIAKAIITQHRAGVRVASVIESRNTADAGSDFEALRQAGVDVLADGNPYLLHHKIIILDGSIVITGSYNFSASAADNNDENVLILHSPEVAVRYVEEFNRVYSTAEAAAAGN